MPLMLIQLCSEDRKTRIVAQVNPANGEAMIVKGKGPEGVTTIDALLELCPDSTDPKSKDFIEEWVRRPKPADDDADAALESAEQDAGRDRSQLPAMTDEEVQA